MTRDQIRQVLRATHPSISQVELEHLTDRAEQRIDEVSEQLDTVELPRVQAPAPAPALAPGGQQPQKITLVIGGTSNVGKTTLGYALAPALATVGIRVTQPFVDAETTEPRSSEEQNAALRRVREEIDAGRLEVEVAEVHLPRSGSTGSFHIGEGVQAFYQRGVLISAIDKFLREAGVLSKDARPLTGGDCLYQLEVYGEYLREEALKKQL